MTDASQTTVSPAASLCKSCGLCCTGHLFAWTKLRSAELDPIHSLGLKVFREPNQRGFNQPCQLWDGVCTIYDMPQYPRFCRTYKCKLLKQVLDEVTPLPSALTTVRETKNLIHELDMVLPNPSIPNFRERLVACLENQDANSQIQQEAKELLEVYDKHFGVTGLLGEASAKS
ncbi:MAG TPA: YkgJ family cysteine cluster protein [Anaerolineales bacterium]